jgi:hypothetical protein
MTSTGISAWIDDQDARVAWERGEGDARQVGWIRDDGARAIETNGDPIGEDDDGFEAAWEGLTGYVILDRDDVSWGSGRTEAEAWDEARRDFADIDETHLVAVRATAAAVAADGQSVRSAIVLDGAIVGAPAGSSLGATGESVRVPGRAHAAERVAVSRAESRAL